MHARARVSVCARVRVCVSIYIYIYIYTYMCVCVCGLVLACPSPVLLASHDGIMLSMIVEYPCLLSLVLMLLASVVVDVVAIAAAAVVAVAVLVPGSCLEAAADGKKHINGMGQVRLNRTLSNHNLLFCRFLLQTLI